jgi:hypothetical protein
LSREDHRMYDKLLKKLRKDKESTKGNEASSLQISRGDFSLFCLAGVIACILWLLDKNPWTVSVCLVVMALFLVHPVCYLPWVRETSSRRLIGILLMILTVGYFGYRVWPEPPNRKLTDAQKETLHNLLNDRPRRIAIFTSGTDREVFDYAEQFFVVLHGANWDVGKDVGSQFGGGPPPKGLQIGYMQNKEEDAVFLTNALKTALGDSASVEKVLLRQGPSDLELLVAQKPR